MERVTYDIDRMSLSDRVYFYIKDLILSGELKGGGTHTGRESREPLWTEPDADPGGPPAARGIRVGPN